MKGDDGLLAGRFTGGRTGLVLPASLIATMALHPENRALDDLWIAVSWGGDG
ncbi:hypothetical protein [Mesorhizobium sp. M0435]|uniref:hypothetical protein n=1 Tax=Mesorhizobium sp. M0435 TaxID=2956944 RepID=UPI003338EC9D